MGGKGSGEASKTRTGFRGWLIIRSNIDQCLKANPAPFALQTGQLSYCPRKVVWPDIDDKEGMQALISAIIDRDLSSLEVMQEQYPEYNLGITEYIKELRAVDADKFPGGRRLLKTVPLRSGMRLDTEIVIDAKKVQHIRAVIRRGTVVIASKILASKPLAMKVANNG